MFFPKLNVGAGFAAATIAASVLVATPSQATITNFASFSALSQSPNIFWTNSGGTGKNGTLFTSANGSAPGSTTIKFSFLQPGLNVVSNVLATFTLLATVTNTAASSLGTSPTAPQTQKNLNGTFSIISQTPITIAGHTYAAGTNLLSATFTNGKINGYSSGGVSDSTSGTPASAGTITYSSAFLNFLPTVDKDFALTLTSITPTLSHTSGKALNNFRANATGTFSTDPAPTVVIPVPESATWAMFIGGFGLMGAALRRRRPEHSLV